MHPLLWEYMKHSQQSNYNGDSLINHVSRIQTKTDGLVRDASCFCRRNSVAGDKIHSNPISE